MNTPVIAIVGGGFCGTSLAINFSRHVNKPLRVLVFNCHYPTANGIAYSTDNMIHLLNVPAGRMSLFTDEPDHFIKWVLSKPEYAQWHTNDIAKKFLPRKIYGMYVKTTFQDVNKSPNPLLQITVIENEVTDINVADKKIELVLKDKLTYTADKVVLATGNHPPDDIRITNKDFYQSEKYFGNPWLKNSVENFNNTKDIFIIGTSLTMVDTVLSLQDGGFKGKIYALSKRGMLPLPYCYYDPYLAILEDIQPGLNIQELLSVYKKHLKIVLEKGLHVDDLTAALRPHTQRIWQELSLADKKKFITHLGHYWAVSRHRLPHEIFSFIEKMIADNKLEIISGRLSDIKQQNDEVEVSFLCKKSRSQKKLSVQRVINCTGPKSDIRRIDSSLIQNLLKKNYVIPDELALGMHAKPEGNLINNNGEASDKLYTMGTNLRGVLWESTAVPELRMQAQQLALKLLSEI